MIDCWRGGQRFSLPLLLSVLLVWSLWTPQPALSAEKESPSQPEGREKPIPKKTEGVSSAPSKWDLCSKPPLDYLLCTFPRHLLEGAQKFISSPESLVALGLAGAAAGALVFVDDVDDDISDHFRDEQPMGQTAEDAGTTLGSPEVLFGLAGTTYFLGDYFQHPRIRRIGETALESLSLAGIATAVLKGATQRERPDSSNNLSFPSFHAAGSFAVAASLHEDYGFGVSVPAFLTAGFISLTRVQEGRHFFSDTLFGAVLGTVAGLAMGRLHRHLAKKGVHLVPLASQDQVGLQITLSTGFFR